MRIIYYSVGFPSGKDWLCWKCVINYEVKSAIVWDFTQRGMAVLTKTILLEPVPVAARSKA
jgi:hypothetical protein